MRCGDWGKEVENWEDGVFLSFHKKRPERAQGWQGNRNVPLKLEHWACLEK